MSAISFIHALNWADVPQNARERTQMCLLDLIGIAAGGMETRLSHIIRDHAHEEFGGAVPIMFDGRTSSAQGAALAAGMTIDSLDGHDGFNPAKGHIGCPLLPALLSTTWGTPMSGADFLAALVMGYEFGARASMAQHGTVCDYHTSGSWGAVTAAAGAARIMGLTKEATRHALGIAEYHGPRSQMMRCIDYPTMLKDGSGWGAMTGVSAARLAARGFTGAPAITVEEAPQYWADLQNRWYILEQYFKPYPVCRWAQAPIEGVLALRRAHNLTSDMVDQITVATFHESIRLATALPKTTEEAQYSTSFPCAVAMVRGGVGPADIADAALNDPEILRLSQGLQMVEDAAANKAFPLRRLAQVTLRLRDGRALTSDWVTPRWDYTAPPTVDEIIAKFHSIADDRLGTKRAAVIADVVMTLDQRPLSDLIDHLAGPISR